MSLSHNSSAIDPQSLAGPYGQDALHHRAVLNRLIDLGADMAELIQQQSKSEVEAARADAGVTRPALGELAVAFDRIVRCVRRTALLVRRLAEPVPVADPARSRVVTRERIIRTVEDKIQREADDEDAPALRAELLDRLDSPDLEDDIGDRPVAEIITEICRDLGLDRMLGQRPWARRTPVDMIVLRARAAAAPRGGTPLVQGIPRCRDP